MKYWVSKSNQRNKVKTIQKNESLLRSASLREPQVSKIELGESKETVRKWNNASLEKKFRQVNSSLTNMLKWWCSGEQVGCHSLHVFYYNFAKQFIPIFIFCWVFLSFPIFLSLIAPTAFDYDDFWTLVWIQKTVS